MNTPFNRPIWLASQSDRRAALLDQISLPFERLAIPDHLDIESTATRNPNEPVRDFVARLAREKTRMARSIVGNDGRLILTADTIVTLDEVIYGKPSSKADAHRMLRALSDRTHQVITAVAISLPSGEIRQTLAQTDVTFKDLTDSEIERYLSLSKVMDKAGSYAIQEYAALFVSHISGSYSNVVGLPLFELGQLLDKIG